VETGVQGTYNWWKELDSGFRRNDGNSHFLTFYEFIKIEDLVKSRISSPSAEGDEGEGDK